MSQTQNRFHPLNNANPGVVSSDGLINVIESRGPKTAEGQKRARKKRSSPMPDEPQENEGSQIHD
jgi:hypothetical protein